VIGDPERVEAELLRSDGEASDLIAVVSILTG
jgi:hypothetical protein